MQHSDYRFEPAARALRYVKNGDKQGASWVFMHLDQAERDAFDAALVESGHPSAFQAGTQERRFSDYVAELVAATA